MFQNLLLCVPVKPRSPWIVNVTMDPVMNRAVIYFQIPYRKDYLNLNTQSFQLNLWTDGSNMVPSALPQSLTSDLCWMFDLPLISSRRPRTSRLSTSCRSTGSTSVRTLSTGSGSGPSRSEFCREPGAPGAPSSPSTRRPVRTPDLQRRRALSCSR